jgi:hypothetical protein
MFNSIIFVKFSSGVDLADFTFFTGVELFAIEDVVSVFFDLVGLLMPKFSSHLWGCYPAGKYSRTVPLLRG